MLTNMLLHHKYTKHEFLLNPPNVFYPPPSYDFFQSPTQKFGPMSQSSPETTPSSALASPDPDPGPSVVGRLKMPPALPKIKLCEVCGHAGATSHYGGTVCGGCKIFFSRTVQSKKGFVCERGGQCPMNAGKRAKCRACRFQLCLKAHMSPEEVGRLRDMRNCDYPPGPMVRREGFVVGYFDENSQPSTSLQDCSNQIISCIDIHNYGNDEMSVLQTFVNLERSSDNNAALRFGDQFLRVCNAGIDMSSAMEFPMPICEKIPMDYIRKEFLEDPKTNMKLFWCRNVNHFLEWTCVNEDLRHFSRQEQTLLIAENFLSIACLTSFYGFLRIQRDQFEKSSEDGTVPPPCSVEWFAQISKLSTEAKISVHRAVSEIMEPMDSLDISMEEIVLLKYIMLFSESSTSHTSSDMYRIRCYRLKYCGLLRKYIKRQIPDPEKRIARISELLKIVESVRNTAMYLDRWMTLFYTSNTCQMNDVLVYDFHVRTWHEYATSSAWNSTSSGIKREIQIKREY